MSIEFQEDYLKLVNDVHNRHNLQYGKKGSKSNPPANNRRRDNDQSISIDNNHRRESSHKQDSRKTRIQPPNVKEPMKKHTQLLQRTLNHEKSSEASNKQNYRSSSSPITVPTSFL